MHPMNRSPIARLAAAGLLAAMAFAGAAQAQTPSFTAEQAKVLGVTLPDPDLKWNEERQHHDFGRIDWDEFWRVIGGNGPCNRERLAARVKAWDDGAWVREAALAYARKQDQQQKVAA